MLEGWFLLLKGLCAGFFYAFMSISGMILVSHYTIKNSVRWGCLAAFGIVTTQIIWSILAFVILFVAFQNLHAQSHSCAIIGAITLFIMAVRIYRSRVNFNQKALLKKSAPAVYSAGVLITLASPVHILGYSAIFAVLGISAHMLSPLKSALSVVGVCFGTLCWWLTFVLTINHTKKSLSPRLLQRLHQQAAMILLIFSVIGLLQLYF